jgi:hypothetical protein
MKFKVGDKVKFLDENGGGIISKIISPSMVNVTIEDGFEIPILTSELLKIEIEAPIDSPSHMFKEDFNVDVNNAPQTNYEADERNIPLLNNPAKGKVDQGIYLAYVPHDQKWLITGLIDIYLVNHTENDVLYNFFLDIKDEGYSGIDYGSVSPGAMILIESVEREEIEKWTKGIVQVLFHQEEAQKILHPGNANFKVRPTRFYAESSYQSSSIIDSKAILISLIPISAQPAISQSDLPIKDNTLETKIIQAKEIKPEHVIEKHKTSPREAVVDLHIYELVENHEKMENNEMLSIQMKYFTQCLESAIANHITKVTFIHGVGTGVLKTAIREVIKDYPNISHNDASMKQFGYGATDVLIRYN